MATFDPNVSTSGLSSRGSDPSAISDPTAPLLRYLTSGQPDSFFERLYASEAAALGMFRWGRGVVVVLRVLLLNI